MKLLNGQPGANVTSLVVVVIQAEQEELTQLQLLEEMLAQNSNKNVLATLKHAQ